MFSADVIEVPVTMYLLKRILILDLADPGTCYEYFSYWHFHIASKEYFWSKKDSNFMHWFKSAILEKLPNCQNGTFEPVHKI